MTTKTIGSGYRLKGGKVEKIAGYGLDASAKIRAKKSKKQKVVRRTKV